MKSKFVRAWASGAAATSLIFCVGCEEDKAGAQAPVVTTADIAKVSTNTPSATPVTPTNVIGAPATTEVIQKARPPETLKVSPALADIIKLTQAGVSDDVMLAYIANGPRVFDVGSEEILYLNDLGASSAVITALIQNDSSPEVLALKKSGTGVKPLPAGLSLTVPATNIYPTAGAVSTQTIAEPAPPAYVAQPPVYPAEPPALPETQPVYATPPSVAYFHDSLSPYGNWVNVDGYGTCWQPTVAVVNSYWRPYGDRGRWLWSDHGWYWYSDYSWGWAPFHYGRWHSSPSVGWFWIPDTTWGPAWVTWRQNQDYCGWAPLPPGAVYNSGVGFSYHGSGVSVGFGFGLGLAAYAFVPYSHFCDRNVNQHWVAPAHAATIYKDSVVVNNYINGNNNTVINQGVGIHPVVKATGIEPQKVAIRLAPSGAVKSARPERLEGAGSSAVLIRPQLPKDPPHPTLTSTRPPPRPASLNSPGTKLSSPAPLTQPVPPTPASSLVEVRKTATSLTIARRLGPPVLPELPSAPHPAKPPADAASATATTSTPRSIDRNVEPRTTGIHPTPNPVPRPPILIRSPTANSSRPKVGTSVAPESYPGAGRPLYQTPASASAVPTIATPGPMQPLGASQPLAAPQPLTAPQPLRPATLPPSSAVRADLGRSYPAPGSAVQPAPSFSRPAPVVRESVAIPLPRPSYEAAPRSFAPAARPEPVRAQPAGPPPSYSAPAAAAPVSSSQAPANSSSGSGRPAGRPGQSNNKSP